MVGAGRVKAEKKRRRAGRKEGVEHQIPRPGLVRRARAWRPGLRSGRGVGQAAPALARVRE